MMIYFRVAVFVVIFIFLSTLSYAGIEIRPNSLKIDDVLIGGNSKSIISITTDSKEGYILSPSANGSISDWISFYPEKDLEVSASMPLMFSVIISPPNTAAEGLYSSTIILDFKRKIPKLLGNKERYTTDLVVSVTKKEITGITVQELVAYNAEKGAFIDIAANITNIGNKMADVNINVYKDGKVLLNVLKLEPKSNVEKIINIQTDGMNIGKNDIKVEVVNLGETITTKDFSIEIKEMGSLKKKLNVVDINAPKVAFEGEEVSFIPRFKNVGESSVYATFKGEIKKDDKLIALIESPKVYSPIGRTRNTEIIFIPQEKGKYVIDSSIHFGDIKTENIQLVLQVMPESMKVQPLRFTLLPILIVLLIVMLIIITRSIIKKRSK